ncbi:TMEM165/GDT1 family protein [Phormidium sp. CLA17]|nr:TMEM165/GDT1 family protein [Leptolyngbya sp. Cla-17]
MPAPEVKVLELKLDPQDVALSEIGIVVKAEQLSAIAPSAASSSEKPPVSSWKVFTSTFVTIFLAELGDKTQMSTLLMSAEFHKPWVIFAGAGTALVATTLIGVWVGQWLSTRLSPRTLDVAAGILLALISAWLVWDVVQL